MVGRRHGADGNVYKATAIQMPLLVDGPAVTLRDDFGPGSDIDLLVEFEPDRIPGLLGVAGIEPPLSERFAGRKVDLRPAEDLSPCFRQQGLDKPEVQSARP